MEQDGGAFVKSVAGAVASIAMTWGCLEANLIDFAQSRAVRSG